MKAKTILIALTGLLALSTLVFQACKKEDDPNKFPSCEITAPSDGEECTQSEIVTISVIATDSDGNITEVRFFVDGNSKESVSSPPYKYDWNTSGESIGSHTLKATSVDNTGASTSDELTIEIIKGESSDFTASPTSGDAPLTVNFTDQSTNNPSSWNWDFGDGSNSTEQSPSHMYNDMGQYDVTLTATNQSGSDTETKTNYITVKGTITDPRDDQTYSIVTIGSQTWFAENLNYETDNSWWYDNSSANGDVYGRLYTWIAGQAACPPGWHTSSDDDWKTLEMYLGMSQIEADKNETRGTDEGKKLKSTSNNGTDEVGFTALMGGRRSPNGSSFYIGTMGYWWTITASNFNGGVYRSLTTSADDVYRNGYNVNYGMSVRCVKN